MITSELSTNAPDWLSEEYEGARVLAWRLTLDQRTAGWVYQIFTDGWLYTARLDGTPIREAWLNMTF